MQERKPFERLKSRVVPLLRDDVDTDQIIPASYLKITDKSGLADGLFASWRRDPDFVLNRREHQEAQILLAGDNFGCGSSREHAPWALLAGGFRAVLSTRFADIFRNNALKNGLLPVRLPKNVHEMLKSDLEADPDLEVAIDLEEEQVIWKGRPAVEFSIDPFARQCLLRGVDQLGHLLEHLPIIEAWEAARSAPIDTRAGREA